MRQAGILTIEDHMLADPLFYRRLCARRHTPTRFIEGLVDGVLRACGR